VKPRIDITGQKFGMLTACRFVGVGNRGSMWECTCECGNSKIVAAFRLRNGVTASCGCLRKFMSSEKLKKHHQLISGVKQNAKCAECGKVFERCLSPSPLKARKYCCASCARQGKTKIAKQYLASNPLAKEAAKKRAKKYAAKKYAQGKLPSFMFS